MKMKKGKFLPINWKENLYIFSYLWIVYTPIMPFFKQDNAAIHTFKLTKDWFKTKNIEVFDWPTKSPDLNPIESLWGILSRVYKNKRQLEIEKL